jgi:hypothetical protein
MSLTYGCNRALPEGVARAWGARWIAPNDQVYDRCSWTPRDDDATNRSDLVVWLNGGALRAAQESAAHMRLGVADPNDDQLHVLFEDEQGMVVGSPQGSHGYVYVAAWLKKDVPA